MIYSKALYYILQCVWICENAPNNDVIEFDILVIFFLPSKEKAQSLSVIPGNWQQHSIKTDKIHGQGHLDLC